MSVNILANKFASSAQTAIWISFVWGVGEIDRAGVDELRDPYFLGKNVWDSNFAFSATCQQAMLRVCHTLRSDTKFSNVIAVRTTLAMTREPTKISRRVATPAA